MIYLLKICHMFIKRTLGGSKAKPIYYLQIVESYREKDKTRHRVLANLGREEELLATGALDNLMEKLSVISKQYFLLSRSKESIIDALIYGPMLVVNYLWWIFRSKVYNGIRDIVYNRFRSKVYNFFGMYFPIFLKISVDGSAIDRWHSVI